MYLSCVDLRLLLRNLYKTLFDKTANFDKRVLLFMEVWKKIKGFEKYEISNLGRLKVNLKYRKHRDYQHKILNPSLDRDGYRRTVLTSLDKNRKSKLIHRLVAIAFIDNPLKKPCVNHINGIKTDNGLDNLEWVTVSENNKHAIKMGLAGQVGGEKHHMAKLTKVEVDKIKALYLKGKSQRLLSYKFNISQTQISRIVNNKRWNK